MGQSLTVHCATSLSGLDRLRNWTILGHNIDYDLRCLNDAAMRMGLLSLSNDRIDTMGAGIVSRIIDPILCWICCMR